MEGDLNGSGDHSGTGNRNANRRQQPCNNQQQQQYPQA